MTSLGVLAILFQASWGIPLLLGVIGWIVISTVVSYYLARLAIRDENRHNGEPGDEI